MSSREQSPEIVMHADNHDDASPKACEPQPAKPASNGAHPHNGSREASQASQGGAASLNATGKSDSQAPLPTVSQLRLSATTTSAQSRPSTAGAASPSQTRASGAGARPSSASTGSGRPPAAPAAAPAPAAKAPSASVPRATASGAAAGRRPSAAGGGSKAYMPKVSTTAPDYTAYPSDVAKYLKEVVRRRDEAAAFKLLPSAQLLDQAVLQEQAAQEQIHQQEALAFLQITHKRREAEAKMKEQRTTKAYKAKMEEQKQQHKEEMVQAKNGVAESVKETEGEVKERLKLAVSLQPRLNIVQAVMAQVQDPASDCALLGALLQEDKLVQKALKGDARYNKSKTADVDGGAAPYWWKQCVCASFNVAAIVKQVPFRASIMDVAVNTKMAADKKVVVVKDADGAVVAWAHTRCGPNPVALAEAYLETPLTVAELPASAYQGIIWPKDDAAEVARAAKGAKSPLAPIASEVQTILSHHEVGSCEMMKKDAIAAGEEASN